ncbi:MAG: ATP-binding protein [Alphaproteobacteria bacterium]|nr:ATP-binding protein [Alphaproteobacteria bacterium]
MVQSPHILGVHSAHQDKQDFNFSAPAVNIPLTYHFQIQSLEQCYPLAQGIGDLFSHDTKKDLRTACHELLVNAIEHGNLEISAEEKQQHIHSGTLLALIEERMQMHPYKERFVSVTCERYYEAPNLKMIRITITDQGKGFDWRKVLDHMHIMDERAQGRGIYIAKNLCFDALHYNESGNQVIGMVYNESKL